MAQATAKKRGEAADRREAKFPRNVLLERIDDARH
jgi:hypothetical protein